MTGAVVSILSVGERVLAEKDTPDRLSCSRLGNSAVFAVCRENGSGSFRKEGRCSGCNVDSGAEKVEVVEVNDGKGSCHG